MFCTEDKKTKTEIFRMGQQNIPTFIILHAMVRVKSHCAQAGIYGS